MFPIKWTDWPSSQSDFLKGNIFSLNNIAIDFSLISIQSLMQTRFTTARLNAGLSSVHRPAVWGEADWEAPPQSRRVESRRVINLEAMHPSIFFSSSWFLFVPSEGRSASPFLSYVTFVFQFMFPCIVSFFKQKLGFLECAGIFWSVQMYRKMVVKFVCIVLIMTWWATAVFSSACWTTSLLCTSVCCWWCVRAF